MTGLVGLMLTISLTQIFTTIGWHRAGFIIVTVTCFLVMLISIGAIRPRLNVVKTNKMYCLGILSSPQWQYTKDIKKILQNSDEMVETYVNEIYNLSRVLKRRFNMLRYAADILAVGLAIGMLIIILQM